MDKIIEPLSKLLPFEKWGLKREIAEPLSIIILVILSLLIGALIRSLVKKHKKLRAMLEDLAPQFDYPSIKKAKKYFIPTQYQNASPSRQEEPGFTHQYIARNKLIPFFTKIAFNQKAESERFYLILADSGMGKTTFMINLFLHYNSFFNVRHRQKMKLLRLADPDTIKIIHSIPHAEAKHTILLLDALDEDRGIISKDPNISDAQAFRCRVDEIIDITRIFSEVIITCRTQYFPGQEDDPYELKIKRPDEKGFYTLNKLYISPFTDKEVRRYLNKKYGRFFFINGRRKRKAIQIVNQAENLVIRPMLLSYIDYLLDDTRNYKSTYIIYATLVQRWLIREAEKRKGINEQKIFVTNLEQLSQNLAIAVYLTWKKENRLYLSKEETVEIASRYNIKLDPQEITGQSLLTCDGLGNWKFAHKSIMEFFLAKEVAENPKFLRHLNFAGMDMARKFYYEREQQPLVHISSENEFYVYPRCIYAQDFPFSENGPRYSPIYKLQYALNYCNDMNKHHGYPFVYDKERNFIDNDGNITKEIKNIRGFRLPTPDEWEVLLSIFLHIRTKGTESTPEAISEELFKNLASISFPEELFFDCFPMNEEWCFDTKGAVLKELKVTVALPKASPDQRVIYLEREGFCSTSTRHWQASLDTHLDVGASFRMVFIP